MFGLSSFEIKIVISWFEGLNEKFGLVLCPHLEGETCLLKKYKKYKKNHYNKGVINFDNFS